MNGIDTANSFTRKPLEASWPECDIEYTGKCPVCSSKRRVLVFDNLSDRIFFCAPGIWTLWRCSLCAVAYIDPRPTLDSIGRAYNTYYTHFSEQRNPFAVLKRKMKSWLRKSYLNKRAGYRFRMCFPFGWVVYTFFPRQGAIISSEIRHLPRPGQKGDRLLDIGCGSGGFLKISRELGYDSEGLEVDPIAREIATRNGLKVHPGPMPGSGLPPNHYKQITLNHVVEHFHDPRAALKEVFSLLQPCGRVWIQTPNFLAPSIRRFGANSRLLEPPRHIVIFDPKSLCALLEVIGFRNVRLLSDEASRIKDDNFVVSQSWMIEQGFDPYATPYSLVPRELKAVSARDIGNISGDVESAEMITITAQKP